MSKNNPKKDKENLKPIVTLFKAHKSLTNVIKKDISKYDFDLNEFGVLEVVYHYELIKVNDIADKVLVNSSGLSYILNKLEKKGLIERVQDTVDKRVYFIKLTKLGIKVSEEIFPSHYEMLNDILSILDDEEKNTLQLLLKKVGLNAKDKDEIL